FIPCDILCLVAQAGGGTLSALAARDRRDTDTGDAVILVGLSLQVATLLVFGGLVCDFALRVRRVGGTAAALDQKPTMVAVRRSWGFRGFAAALAVSAGCVFARCVYRVFEMSGGYGGPLMARQDLFVVFEGGMISVAVLALNVFHPALCFDRLVPDDDDDDDDESRGRDATAAAATATARPAAKSCCDLKRSISVNSFNRDFVGSSLGPGGYDTSSKVSTSSSFDVIPEDAYERPVNSLGRDLTNRFSKCV
ncbi:RTA1 like protein-domain-containing protein, partial [Biscogniauxia mediterranea]